MEETVHLYYINDLHSHFKHWKRIEAFIQRRRILHEDVKEEMIVTDIGDHVDRFHPYTEALLGKGNIALLNALGCQYATIGNNEGITFSHHELNQLYDEAQFSVVVSNLYHENGERPKWAVPYKIHETAKGNKVAFIGATAAFQAFYELLGWHIVDPLEEIRSAVAAVKEQCDVIILLSHLGIEYDEKLAREIPEIHMIIGAHTHHVLHDGKRVNQTLLCGAGMAGRFVGHAEVVINPGTVPQVKTSLYEMNQQNPVQGEDEFANALYHKGKELLSVEIAHLPKPIPSHWFEDSPLGQRLCDMLLEWCNADCAFLNAGLLLEGLEAGSVTLYDLHRICPHPINPCVIELSGQELKEVLVQSMDETWPHWQIKGFGFRGRVLGKMIYSNISIRGPHDIYIKQEKLELKKTYRLAIPDMFTFGHFFPSLKRNEKKTYYLPEFLRDLLKRTLTISPAEKSM
ncbi:MAG: bifunctional metallophosphatase/5'-nucleotidase [Bacillus sp. (in: firmicutes)]